MLDCRLFNTDEKEVKKLLRHPHAAVALSDAGAHLSFLCDAGFGLHLFGHWVRDRGDLTLPEAVKRVTHDVAAAYRPFEGARRAFVIEAAEAMADESQNALLKTLEEPAPFAHLVLICSDPELLARLLRDGRCQPERDPAADQKSALARTYQKPPLKPNGVRPL